MNAKNNVNKIKDNNIIIGWKEFKQMAERKISNLISENNIEISMQILEICWDDIFSEVERLSQIWFTKSTFYFKLFQLMATLIIILYFIGILALFINRYYLIMVLLRIEFIYISLLLILCIYFCLFNLLGIFTFLIRIVCEAGLGLRLLVIIRFFYGNEIISRINLIKC